MTPKAQREKFIKALFGQTKKSINLRAIKKNEAIASDFVSDANGVQGFIKKYRDRDIYFGVCTRETGNGTKNGCREITALWCDIDGKDFSGGLDEVTETINTFPFRTSAIISSGSENSFHLYWFLKEPEDATEKIEGYLKGIAKVLNGDMAATDLSRIMRLPGTKNYKNGNAKDVVLKQIDENLRFHLTDFEEFYLEQNNKESSQENKTPIKDLYQGVDEGTRNASLARLVGKLFSLNMTYKECLSEALRVNERNIPPLPVNEVKSVVDSIYKKDQKTKNITLEQPVSWHDPLSLPGELTPVSSLNPDLTPEPLRNWIIDISERMQCPIDYVAVAAIIEVATIVGARCVIFPKEKDNWEVTPNLWGCIVGPPSQLKTPAANETFIPSTRLILKSRETFENETQNYEIEKTLMEVKKEELKQRMKKSVAKEGGIGKIEDFKEELKKLTTEDLKLPQEKRYKVNDATVEKLGEILNANPQGVLLYRDELSGWFAQLDKPGRESDRAFYLESWSGNSSFTYDRIGRGTIHIDTCCVSLFGTTQPGKLMAYLKQALTGVGNDGLIQRLQLMVYPDEKKEWKLVDRAPDKEAKDKAFHIFENLDKADFSEYGGTKKDGEYATSFRFTPEAQTIFNTWQHDLEKLIREEDEHPAINEHLAKYRSLMPSLALLFHLIDVAAGAEPGNVSEGAAIKAAALTGYLEQHARRIYGLVIAGEVKAAKLLLNKIKAKKLKDGFKVRDIYRNGWTMLNTCEDAQVACELLCDYDWLIPAELPPGIKGGRLTTSYRINPKIYEAKI